MRLPTPWLRQTCTQMPIVWEEKGMKNWGGGGGDGHDILPEELVCLHRGGDLALGFGGWSDFNVL